MKFSVVIPCHDRLNLLKEAVYTVLQQDWFDWELIIFDNASDKELMDFIKNLGDPRIRYDRSDQFLAVTESWNRAIDMASGDYIIFLGDDDGLTPNFFSRIAPIIAQFNYPEILYSAFYLFTHPGVAPCSPEGFVAEVKTGFFFLGQNKPFLLSQQQAYKAVKGSLKLRRNFAFNIQAFVFSQKFLSHLKKEGPIFRSPFPDYYIANIAFAKSKSIVIIPEARVITGVSKASVGYALLNGLEDRFEAILNTKLSSDLLFNEIQDFVLPGPIYNTNYILTMEYVVRYIYPFLCTKVDYHHYRRLQIYSLLLNNIKEGKKYLDASCWNRLNIFEKIWTLRTLMLLKLKRKSRFCSRFISFFFKKTVNFYAFNSLVRPCNEGNYHKLIDVFNDMQKGALI